MDMLTITVVVLWIVVVALGIVVFALARQVGVLYERVAPAGALMLNQQLKVGDQAPGLSVTTLTGEIRKVAAADAGQRAQLLFFLAPDCPICKTLLPVLKSLRRAEPMVQILLISDGGEVAEHQAFVAREQLAQFDYVLSEQVGRSFGVGKLPYAVLIDPQGKIVSLGLVNSREHVESLFEAERLGVATIQDYLSQNERDSVLHYDAVEK